MFKCRFLSLLLTMMLFVSCSTVPITGRKQLSFISQSQLIGASIDAYSQLLSKSKLSTDTKKKQLVADVGTKIASSAEEFMRENGMEQEIETYHWEFNLIEEDKTVNAFCMPGGKIAVYTGWIELQKEPIPSVLALIILVAVFNTVGTLLMIVLEKTNAVGILKTLGSKRKQIVSIFLIHGAILSVVGIALGSILGYMLMFIQQEFNIITLPSSVYFMSKVPFLITADTFISIAIITLLLSFWRR